MLAACAPTEPATPPDVWQDQSALQLLIESAPHHLRAHVFAGQTTYPSAFVVPDDCALEFVPLAETTPGDGLRLRVFAAVDGAETLLHETRPVPAAPGATLKQGAARRLFTRLGRPERIDLTRFAGQRLSLRWAFSDGDSSRAGALAQVRVARTAPPDAPHVLLVCSDTHRFDHVAGERGRELMPALAGLRDASVHYSNAFSTSSWTLPAIVSSMTGLNPRHHLAGFRRASVPLSEVDAHTFPPGQFRFDTRNVAHVLTGYSHDHWTVTEALQRNGYATAAVVTNPLYGLSGLLTDGQDIAIDVGVVPGERVNQAAFRVIDSRPPDRPLFLLVHYIDVHEWKRSYYDPEHPGAEVKENAAGVRAAYERTCRDADEILAALLRKWEASVGTDNSMVVFYSDHGEHLVDPGARLVGHGNTMREALLQIPLVVRYPASMQVSPGEIETPVSILDLPATVLDVAGLESAQAHGTPLTRVGTASERVLFADSQLFFDELSTVRRGPFKLIINHDQGTENLYDLRLPRGDRGELDQKAADAAVRTELLEAFMTYRAAAERASEDLAFDQQIDQEEALERLRALGYVK